MLPEDVILLTMAVDVQARYLATLVAGWAVTGECWMIDYAKVEGDTRSPELWNGLGPDVDAARYEHPAGDLPIHLCGIDSGFLAGEVYQACNRANRLRPGQRWFIPTKGVGGLSGAEPIILPVRDERDSHGRRGARPLRVNTDEAKAALFAMLAVKEPGPWHVHFSKRLAGTDLAAELVAEEQRTKFDADGVVVGTEWKKRTADARNEGLDCAVICLALFHYVTRTQWLHLLCKRYGKDKGIAVWRTKYPEGRIYGVDYGARA